MKELMTKCFFILICYLSANGILYANDSQFVPPRPQPSHPSIPNLPVQPNVDVNLQLGTINRGNNNNATQAQQVCGQQCCLYQNEFYSEGAVVNVSEHFFLQCVRNPNVFGANSLYWSRIQ